MPKMTFTSVLKLNSSEWKPITIASISSFINGFEEPLMTLVFSTIMGSLSNPSPEVKLQVVMDSKKIIITLGAIIGTTNFIQCFFYALAAERLSRRLRINLFANILKQETAFFDKATNTPETLCLKLSGDASDLKRAASQVGVILQFGGTMILALIISFAYEWRIALFALCLLPLLIWALNTHGRMSADEFHGMEELTEECSKVASEAILYVRTVSALGCEKTFRAKYAKQYAIVNLYAKNKAHYRGFIFGLSQGIYNFVFAATLYFGGLLIVDDAVCYCNVLKSSQALLLGASSSAQLFMYSPMMEALSKSATSVLTLTNRKTKIEEPPVNNLIFFRGSGEASLEKVKFRYPTRPNVLVLNGFDLKIETGQTVGLVGPSGCGKSTVIRLLLRSYVPDEGKVCLDGIPLNELREFDARQSIGLVSQESVVFDRTIAENIAYGDCSRDLPLEEIIEVARMVNLHKFIMSLPQGYDTVAGIKGASLSDGQKRRLAIARALIRKPKLLLLDEAANSLDSESERKVQDALEQARSGRACLTVAHRLSRVRYTDLIAVMNEGRIVEQGTHNDLIKKKGLYYELNMYEKRISMYIR